MSARIVAGLAGLYACASIILSCGVQAAESSRPLSLSGALQKAVASNPRLIGADKDIAIAKGRSRQAGAIANPELSVELDNAFGSGQFRGLKSAESTLQLSQLFELGQKRDARVAAASAEVQVAAAQLQATRLEVLSDTAVAFYGVLVAQRRVAVFDEYLESLRRLSPLLQSRVEAGASSPAEVARVQVAADFVQADRERARTALAIAKVELAALMGQSTASFGRVTGDIGRIIQPPPFQTIQRAINNNPQLARFSALRSQRDAEFLVERLKPLPDLRAGIAWRHFRDTNDNAFRLGVSMPLPIWDQNSGNIAAAQDMRAKVDLELAAARSTLLLTLGRAYENLLGAVREVEILRRSALPNIRRALDAVSSGYGQGRFTLLELLDAHNSSSQASLREAEALLAYHTALATIESLIGAPVRSVGER